VLLQAWRWSCPKGLNPGKAIAEIKKMIVERES
jgi:succinate dehydrogenase/fumarate reductase-like Fe-S protein